MASDDEGELQSLLSAFKAQKSPTKLTPTKVRQPTPRSATSSASTPTRWQFRTVTPLPSPLTAYTPSTDQPELTPPSDQRAATIGQPVELSKEEQAEAIVLSLIQDRATGVDWDTEPHVSNLRSVFHLEHDEAVGILQIWYPCINESRVSRAVERHRQRVQKEEDEGSDVEIVQVRSKVGTSFDSAIVLDSEEEMGEAHHQAGNSFDSAIVISDEEGNGEKTHQDEVAKISIEASEVLLPSRYRTPSPPVLVPVDVNIVAPKTPNNAVDVSQLPTPVTTSRPLVQHSRGYSPPATPTRLPESSLHLTGRPGGKRPHTALEEDAEIELRAAKIPRKGLYAPSLIDGPVLDSSTVLEEEQQFKVLEKAQESYPSPSKTPQKNIASFRDVDRSSPTPQQRTVKATTTKVKRSKFLKADSRTELPNAVLKAQRTDRSDILIPKGSNQLPKDRMVLALLSDHKDRQRFVTNVFGEERRQLWAPELRGILSVETIQRCGRFNRGLEVGDETGGL
ncbi:hypothetical protein EG328_002294 [Venturia inaequalis]|uniref:Uncharacterized protein n=1 Tax=Venturia inaequalis TaxID=5025 RepID=A0A8H3UWI2_VENIN|nr:hypothetical protein EG328_002294 [Venturia inaequalis]KAE9981257.1 hypothetical protein EG327_006268 [Venturia inaequalis]